MKFWILANLFTLWAHAEDCASKYSQLDNIPTLTNFKNLLGDSHSAGFINETKGSYIHIDSLNDQLTVTLFSSSLFDLLAIKKESALKVCDRDGRLIFEAFGMKNAMTIAPDQIQIDKAGPKYQFRIGEMTPILRRLHPVESRLPASTP